MFKQLQNDIHQKCILVRTLDCIEVGWLVGWFSQGKLSSSPFNFLTAKSTL